MIRIAVLIAALVAGLPAFALAQNQPEEALRGHFAAISAEDYSAADQYFSEAFLRAFKADVAALNTYYLARRQQLAPGYTILAVEPLSDKEREAVVATVEFADPHPEAPVGVTERMYYYLLHEKVPVGAAGRDEQGLAWRIEIYDALKFDSLAEARRRPYLNTREAWADDASRELKSRQGIYRIQNALEMFKLEHGQYPFRLLGEDNRRDELISGGHLIERYPPSGFASRPMRSVDFGERSSGDFTYFSLDQDGDGVREGYWLVLHGKLPEQYLFEGHDAILVAGSSEDSDQRLLAEQFGDYWAALSGKPLAPAAGLLALGSETVPSVAPADKAPRVAASVTQAAQRLPRGDRGSAPTRQLADASPAAPQLTPQTQIGQPVTDVETLEPVVPSDTLPEAPGEPVAAVVEQSEPAATVVEPSIAVEPARPAEASTADVLPAGTTPVAGALRIAQALVSLALRIAAQAPSAPAVAHAVDQPQADAPLVVHSYGF